MTDMTAKDVLDRIKTSVRVLEDNTELNHDHNEELAHIAWALEGLISEMENEVQMKTGIEQIVNQIGQDMITKFRLERSPYAPNRYYGKINEDVALVLQAAEDFVFMRFEAANRHSILDDAVYHEG